MDTEIIDIKEKLDTISRLSITLEPEDIPTLGDILNIFVELERVPEEENYSVFKNMATGLKGYVEKIILADVEDLGPYKEGVQVLRGIWSAVSSGNDFSFDISEVMDALGQNWENKETVEDDGNLQPRENEVEKRERISSESLPAIIEIDSEDIDILKDFIVESRDSLESIEVKLVDLEQNPSDKEIINDIFRPFHTIKGVAGFLDLKNINRLAHKTENILDSSRQGDFIINDIITDIILASVDSLKQMLLVIDEGIEQGQTTIEDPINCEPLFEKIDQAISEALGQGRKPMGEILIEKGVLDKKHLDEALDIQKKKPEKKLGEILIHENIVKTQNVINALRDQKSSKRSAAQVKVDTTKLDNLVDLTGELVIAQSMLKQKSMEIIKDQKFVLYLSQLGQIVTGIQKTAMSMRMIPINSTFQKMVRLVRDLSRNSGKKVDLQMVGEDTEIDRNVVDALYEPLVHMIRNSIDHGVELPDEREKSGKNKTAVVIMRAYHKSGNIVIEIEDDGKGLNKEKILEKGISNGIIDDADDIKDSEIYELIMNAGFSTADKITDISGRGVGMDVVKKTIEGLHGRINIQSEEGKGSTFKITLPLTLAIIEGMLVRVGAERYIVPTLSILESFKPTKKDYYTVEGKGEMIMFRGNLVPVLRLDKIFNIEGDTKNPWDGLVVVVENKNELKGLLLDELLGKEEFVIKSLGESFKGVPGVAGGTIMGDGRIGLILDMEGLFKFFR